MSQMSARGPRLRWTSQEPTKAATAAQFTAARGAARSQTCARAPRLRWTSQEPTKAAIAQFATT
eukprot:3380098-Pyramimonas_sp.AAC.1